MSIASPEDQGILAGHLAAGEHVEWTARPRGGVRLTRADAYLVPFSLLWGGFAIFWEVSAIEGGGGPFFVLWGIPFVAMGLYMIVGRFFYAAYRNRRTVYAVTDHRVLRVASNRRGDAVDAMYLSAIPSVSTTVGPHGRGDVLFGTASPGQRWYGNTGLDAFNRGSGSVLAFYDVDDPGAVAELVDRLRAAR
jgi:hypothetical protein